MPSLAKLTPGGRVARAVPPIRFASPGLEKSDGLEWLQLATGLEAFAKARGDLR
jgi:hypothetical protein